MKVVYVAAPLGQGADRETNRAAAAQWCGWIAETFNVAISADWIVLSGVWTEDKRELGLATDMEMVSRADEVWQVGPRVSPGMALEGAHARALGQVVRDFTGWDRARIESEAWINWKPDPPPKPSANVLFTWAEMEQAWHAAGLGEWKHDWNAFKQALAELPVGVR